MLLSSLRNSQTIFKFSSLSVHYKVLGLPKNANLNEIKKKYYELAKMFHPDVNQQPNAHQKFAEITKAYQILSQSPIDQQNKQSSSFQNKHNPFAKTSQKRKKASFQEDWEDYQTYDSFFKSNRKFQRPKKGQDIFVNATITLKQSIKGVKKVIKFSRKVHCPKCIQETPQNCFTCGGKGQIFDRRKKQKTQCSICQGIGYILDCQQCNDTRFVSKDVSQQIYIEKGTQDKNILRVKFNGHQGYKHSNGDLYKLQVDGNNVISEHQLEYLTAIFGGQIQIDTLHGLNKVEIPAGTQSGFEVRLFNYGLKSTYSKRVGDHILKFKIKVPQNLTQRQRELMDKLMLDELS